MRCLLQFFKDKDCHGSSVGNFLWFFDRQWHWKSWI